MNNNQTVTVSAYSSDYSEKAYKFHFANGQFEFVPKSQVKFVETGKGEIEFGEGIQSRFFEMPVWLVKKLKGINYYSIM